MKVRTIGALTASHIGKTGMVKEDVFFQLLSLHAIELSKEAKTLISSSYKLKDKIKYNEALTVIAID
jgi:hypothetical protein